MLSRVVRVSSQSTTRCNLVDTIRLKTCRLGHPLKSSLIEWTTTSLSHRRSSHQQRRWLAGAKAKKGSRPNPLGLEDDASDDEGVDRGNESGDDGKKSKEIVLFERSQGNLTFEGVSFVSATFCSIFFAWYVLDVVPTVNASGIEELHVSPWITGFGLAGSIIFQVGATMYPIHLISKLSLRSYSPSSSRTTTKKGNQSSSNSNNRNQKKNDELLLYLHTLPFARPATRPLVYELGDIRLNTSSYQAETIVKGGDITKFKGFIPLYKAQAFLPFPYILHINKPEDVLQHDLLFQSILHTELLSISNTAEALLPHHQRRKKSKKTKKRR